ncbi:MAG: site-2 protease family protein [Candidatus Peribacteraceae bacterium]|jgi:Zn-dependent protease|nr:site-2 protease family protein [Candidatus Peribacteraceae bacterium]
MLSSFVSPPFIISILVAISVHEAAHGWMAARLGDPTAYNAGRLTLNPLAHIDLMGALMFLVVGFGWAKPVPVNPMYFHRPKRDTALVSLAGPASNLLLGSIAFFGLLFMLRDQMSGSVFGLLTIGSGQSVLQQLLLQILGSSAFINFGLMAFNLLPIAPLDGSKILHIFIPLQYEDQYETLLQRGPMILLILILAGVFLHVPILSTWVFGIVNFTMQALLFIASPLL